MSRKKNDGQPTDMHSDGVHFDKDILQTKRSNSSRATSPGDDTSDKIKDSDSSKDKKREKGQKEEKKVKKDGDS